MKKKFELWLLAAALTLMLLLVALTLVYLAFLAPFMPLVVLFLGVMIIARYTVSEDVLQFIKWKWL